MKTLALILLIIPAVCLAAGSSNYNLTRSVIAPTLGSYPAKGEVRTDPTTGAAMKRIADHGDLAGNYAGANPTMSLIVYSRYTPSNTTGELVLIHGEDSTSCWIARLSDNTVAPFAGTPKAPIRFKPSMGTSSRALGELNELRWDYSGAHPYRLYFVGRSLPGSQSVQGENVGMSFYYTDIDPATGVNAAPVLIRDFSADFPSSTGGEIMNDVEGDSSNDSRYWAWQVMDTSLGTGYKPYAVFTYDKTANQILGSIRRSCSGMTAPCTVVDTPATSTPYLTRPNMVEMSPLGTRVIVDWGRPYTGNRDGDIGTLADGPKAFLKDFSDPHRIGTDETHSGWAWGPNGEELFVSQNNRNDFVEAANINKHTVPLESNGVDRSDCTVISGNSYTCGTQVIAQTDLASDYDLGMHFAKVYDPNKKGWLFMGTSAASNSLWGKNQTLFVEVKPYSASPKVWRVNPSYNLWYDYRSEGTAALDFAGTSVYLTANWGYTDGRAEAYSIGLPDNWYAVLTAPIPAIIGKLIGSIH